MQLQFLNYTVLFFLSIAAEAGGMHALQSASATGMAFSSPIKTNSNRAQFATVKASAGNGAEKQQSIVHSAANAATKPQVAAKNAFSAFMNNAGKKLRELPANALYAVLAPIEFVAQAVILAPFIIDSIKKQNSYRYRNQQKEAEGHVPNRVKFIAAIEKIIELGDASIENIFQILQGLEDEFAKSSEKVSISANKLKNLVSEALQHKDHYDPRNGHGYKNLNAPERMFLHSVVKAVQLREWLSHSLNQTGHTVGENAKKVERLAAQGAIALLAILLAPVEIGAHAAVVFSLMYSQHRQRQRSSYYGDQRIPWNTQIKYHLIMGMARLEEWGIAMGEHFGKNVNMEEIVNKTLSKLKPFSKNEDVKLESAVEEILTQKVHSNAKTMEEIYKTLEKAPTDGVEIHKVDNEIDVSIKMPEDGEDHQNNILNIQGIGHHDPHQNPHHRRRKRAPIGEGKHVYGITSEMSVSGHENLLKVTATVCAKECKDVASFLKEFDHTH